MDHYLDRTPPRQKRLSEILEGISYPNLDSIGIWKRAYGISEPLLRECIRHLEKGGFVQVQGSKGWPVSLTPSGHKLLERIGAREE